MGPGDYERGVDRMRAKKEDKNTPRTGHDRIQPLNM